MTNVALSDSPARKIQTKIDVLQAELHNHVRKLVVGSNMSKNAHYKLRHEVITKAINSGQLPRTFWADAIIATLRASEGDEGRLLGTYDAALLKDYLQDMRVEYTEEGVRVVLVFSPNPFFEETELWGEERCYADCNNGEKDNVHEEEDEEKEREESIDDVCRFSGITWKPGHGPECEDSGDDANKDDKNKKNNSNGQKRERSPSETKGWSFLDVFSIMPPHPEDDDLFDEEDEDEIADAVDSWEAEMEDRKDLLLTLVEDVWADPVAAIVAGRKDDDEKNDSSKQPFSRKIRTE